MRTRTLLFIISSLLAGTLCYLPRALAQQPTEQEKQIVRDILDNAFSGKTGALEVSYLLADCHGFQSSLYNHLTRQAIITGDDIDLAQKISRQSLTAGWTAAILAFEYKDLPDQHVNLIANDARREWAPKLKPMGNDLDDAVWEKFAFCTQLAPASEILIEIGSQLN